MKAQQLAEKYIDPPGSATWDVACCVCSHSAFVDSYGKPDYLDALAHFRAEGWSFSEENGARCADCTRRRARP